MPSRLPGRRRTSARGAARAAQNAGTATGDDIYRLVADSSPEWEYITDDKVRLIYSSPSCEPMTGLTAEAMTADPEAFYRIVHPDDLPIVLQHDAALAGPADPSEMEFRIIHPDHGERWLGHVCRPLFDATGGFVGRRGTLRDITKRKKAERQVIMAQTILDHIGDIAFLVGEDGHPVYMNDAACRALGYSREDITSVSVREMDAGGITTHWAGYWEEIRSKGSRTFETLARTSDGRTFPVEVQVNYIEFEGRGYHCGFARDISERKAVLEALAESEARFRAMANTVPDILFTNAADGRCDYANQHCYDYTGMPPGSVEGYGWLQVMHPDDRLRAERAWKRSIRKGVPFAEEVRLRGADGTYRWFVDRAQPIRCPAGKVTKWFGAATDIDQLKRAQEQLKEARATLEDKVKQRTADLQAANAALRAEIAERRRLEVEVLRIAEWEQRRIGQDLHDDLCQQLAAIAYMCESVRPSVKPDSPRTGAKIRRIGELLQQALADARGMARGLSPLNVQAHGLRAALRELAAATRTSRGVNCRVACPDTLLRGDVTRATHIYRIVQEALNNAIRHGKARTIHIALRATRRHLRLTIEDDGRGVARRPRHSNGMGLGSMRYRAHAMGGSFDIRRRPSGGTVVTCIAPLLAPDATVIGKPQPETARETA
jgi:PAS domain S-box-containing protein